MIGPSICPLILVKTAMADGFLWGPLNPYFSAGDTGSGETVAPYLRNGSGLPHGDPSNVQRKRRVGKRQPKIEQPERSKPEQPTRTLPQRSGLEFLPANGSYNKSQEDLLKKTLGDIAVDNEKCAKAFHDAGLRDPLTLIAEVGLVFAPATSLRQSGTSLFGISGDTLKQARQRAESGGNNAFTVTNRQGDPRPMIFLNSYAFNDSGSSLRGTLVHELIHAAGIPPWEGANWYNLGYRTGMGNDLTYYKHFQTILDACK